MTQGNSAHLVSAHSFLPPSGPKCTGPKFITTILIQGEITEDCLYLTINVPQNSNVGGTKLPVMVWVHGGGFFQGAGNDRLYDAERLSNLTGTIVVTLNYRLGRWD